MPAESVLFPNASRRGEVSLGGPPPIELVPAPETPGSRVRGDRALRVGERAFLLLDRLLGRAIPDELNPFLHTGAVALTALAIATVTGVLLLFWYSPSVHFAYASVDNLSPYAGGLVRSLHRYSSDACMFFVVVHALRLFFERRFSDAQWLAWVTGLAAVGMLWFIGWTGYWLVWDTRAQHVAVGTARLLDVLPIFADPMGRSFLSDTGVNSLLFFVVFFMHMLVPLGMGVALWLHVARLARARFLTKLPMTLWVCGSLLMVSLAWPAVNAEPARMTALGQRFAIDPWYLIPLLVTDRLGGGAMWSLLLASGVLSMSVPWWMRARRVETARVETVRCNACNQCYQDCPYDAISMVRRNDPRSRHELVALVDPNKCVGCGICSGSCDSVGVGFDSFNQMDQRERIEGWLSEAAKSGEPSDVLFFCAHSAGAGLKVDPATGRCAELPGVRAFEVPCAGWVHTLTLELALRRGGKEAFVVACPPGSCRFREGVQWTQMRLDGERAPSLRADKVDRGRIHTLYLDSTRTGDLLRAVRNHAASDLAASRPPSRFSGWLATSLLAVVVAGGLGAANEWPHRVAGPAASELVVTFKHPGSIGENCRQVSEEEKARMPVHMRRDKLCERRRSDVRLRVAVDGNTVVERSYAPAGVWSDGNSVAVERVPLAPGEHLVSVAIGDTHDENEWTHVTEDRVAFSNEARRVLIFDRLSGFAWH